MEYGLNALDALARHSLAHPPSLLASATGTATLVTNEGTVTGTTIGSVARFANIPFAKPPERWSPPEPPEQYPNGTRDGTEFGPNCVELDGSGSEDCLLLNVFAPASAIGQPSAKLPVLVWVHGGAYQSGGAKLYDATNLVEYLDGKATVVSINYRLHIFGFPAHWDMNFFHKIDSY